LGGANPHNDHPSSLLRLRDPLDKGREFERLREVALIVGSSHPYSSRQVVPSTRPSFRFHEECGD
jgi:hypothetical protein